MLLTSFSLLAQDGPSHVIVTHRIYPEKRIGFRNNLPGQAARLNHWRDDGFIMSYQVLQSSLVDDEGMEGILIAKMGTRGFEIFKRLDLTEGSSGTSTVPVDLVEAGGDADMPVNTGVFLVVPADCGGPVSPALLGAFAASVKNESLLGYRFFVPRYPAGRSWNALFVLHFPDWLALAQRQSWVGGGSGCGERVAVIAEAVAGK